MPVPTYKEWLCPVLDAVCDELECPCPDETGLPSSSVGYAQRSRTVCTVPRCVLWAAARLGGDEREGSGKD